MIKKYINFDESVESIKTLLDKKCDSSGINFVSIWGPSASGKTTLARKLVANIDDSALISVDSYLTATLSNKVLNHFPKAGDAPYIEGLDPAVWDLGAMNKDLERIHSGQNIKVPIYNHSTKTRDGYFCLKPKKIIFIEGAYSMDNSVSSFAVASVILHADLHDCLIRKLVRTLNINGRTDVDQSIQRYLTQTNTSSKHYINLYKNSVDYVIHNPLNPIIEFENIKPKNNLYISTNSVALVPKKRTGTLKNKEKLMINLANFELSYIVNDKILFLQIINNETYTLLTKHYKVVA